MGAKCWGWTRRAARFGLYSASPVLPELETEDEWQDHRTHVFADARPNGYLEQIITERIALNSWRLRRLIRYEHEP